MNVLLFVTSLLIVLSIMTYARLDNFRYFLGIQAEFTRYMESVERSYINSSAEKWYDKTRANKKTPADGGDPSQTDSPKNGGGTALRRLSLRYILDPKERTADNAAYLQQSTQWLKDLMRILYGNQLFFKEMEVKRPTFLDDIIQGMIEAMQALPQKPQIWNSVQILANLKLQPELEDAYYLMLKGCLKPSDPNQEAQQLQQPQQEYNINLEGNMEDETDNSDEAMEYTGSEGYDSLLNYVTFNKSTKIRVYLASKELLLAIYGQPSTVESIIIKRNALFRSLDSGMTPDDASKEFEGTFKSAARGNVDAYLDFRVSKTNPGKYN